MIRGNAPQFFTIAEYLFNSGQLDEKVAIEGIDGRYITYCGLRKNINEMVNGLNSLGFKRNDRIAIAFTNEIEMAVSLVAVPTRFTAIPMNPSIKMPEFKSYLEDIGAKALLTNQRDEAPLRDAAKSLGIETIEIIQPKEKRDGLFSVDGIQNKGSEVPEFAQAEDVAFIMQSAGTTSKPKWIPRTQSNVCWMIDSHRKILGTTPDDKMLILAPLFHGQGLFVLYENLFAGSTAVCANFKPLEFYGWLDSIKPTTYVGGPTLHQWVLDTAAGREDVINRTRLRIIRTGAGSTSRTIMEELEKLFRTRFVETYSMTEAGTIAWNPDASHDGGFRVCFPLGPEVAIIGDRGELFRQGETGEIAVRGPSLFRGYENNPVANSSVFINGWFRTGDRGYLDNENRLHLAGRIKEDINRGGEKIAPQEVERALLEHPAVAEAVVFPVPHRTLVEDVAAAVVLKVGQSVSEDELRAFLFDRVVYFKVPTRILFVNCLPMGLTGKMSRVDMARKIGLS